MLLFENLSYNATMQLVPWPYIPSRPITNTKISFRPVQDVTIALEFVKAPHRMHQEKLSY